MTARNSPDGAVLGSARLHRRSDGVAVVLGGVGHKCGDIDRRRFGQEGVLAAELTADRATDIVWLLNSPAVHQQLVRAAGWSTRDYVAWLGGTLTRELLESAPRPDPAR